MHHGATFVYDGLFSHPPAHIEYIVCANMLVLAHCWMMEVNITLAKFLQLSYAGQYFAISSNTI